MARGSFVQLGPKGFVVTFNDGRNVVVPWAACEGLANAVKSQRSEWHWGHNAESIYWPRANVRLELRDLAERFGAKAWPK